MINCIGLSCNVLIFEDFMNNFMNMQIVCCLKRLQWKKEIKKMTLFIDKDGLKLWKIKQIVKITQSYFC